MQNFCSKYERTMKFSLKSSNFGKLCKGKTPQKTMKHKITPYIQRTNTNSGECFLKKKIGFFVKKKLPEEQFDSENSKTLPKTNRTQ